MQPAPLTAPPSPTPASSTVLLQEAARYVVVGGGAFAVDVTILSLLTSWAGVHYLISAAIAFSAGITCNYLLSVGWVFRRRTVAHRGVELAVFVAVGGVGLALNELILWVATDLAGLHYLQSKVASAAIVLAWNFGARKALLFR